MDKNRAEREVVERSAKKAAESVTRKAYEESQKRAEAERQRQEQIRWQEQQQRMAEEAQRQRAEQEGRRRQEERNRAERESQENQSQGAQSIKDEKYYRSVLNLGRSCSSDEIRQAYRSLVAQYHPDKVNHLGPKLKQLAEDEMKRINEAYEYFRKNKVV